MTPLLEVRNLGMSFPLRSGVWKRRSGSIRALSDVTFSLRRGETLGVVGESGSGKTTLARTIVRLYRPTSGSIRLAGQELAGLDEIQLKPVRRTAQIVFQDPYASLNGRMTVATTLQEPLIIHGMSDRQQRQHKVDALLEMVGLRSSDGNKLPHQLSGGQRQRVGIARALVLEPDLIIADEPVSALDVSIQSQILNLLVDLQSRLSLTYIFISHDLTVVKYVSDRIAVMYLGRFVELASAAAIHARPRHPYTRALLSANPTLRSTTDKLGQTLSGEMPSPAKPPSGCAFHLRCPHATDLCQSSTPTLEARPEDNGHLVACHLADEIDGTGSQ